MSNYFTVLSDDWVQPQKAVYVPPSKRKEDPKSESCLSIKNDDFPDLLGSKLNKPQKNVLQMSAICFKEKSSEITRPTDQEYNKIKDDWFFSVIKNGKRINELSIEHKESLVETAARYDEEETHIPDLVGVVDEVESESEVEYSDSDDYAEIKEEIDIPSKEEMDNYVAKVEKLKKKLGTNLNNEKTQKGMIKVFIANQVKVFTEF